MFHWFRLTLVCEHHSNLNQLLSPHLYLFWYTQHCLCPLQLKATSQTTENKFIVMSVKWKLHKREFTELSRKTSIASKSSGWSPVKSLTSWSIWNIKSNTNTEKGWSKFHPGGPQVAAPIDLDIAISQQRSFCVIQTPMIQQQNELRCKWTQNSIRKF